VVVARPQVLCGRSRSFRQIFGPSEPTQVLSCPRPAGNCCVKKWTPQTDPLVKTRPGVPSAQVDGTPWLCDRLPPKSTGKLFFPPEEELACSKTWTRFFSADVHSVSDPQGIEIARSPVRPPLLRSLPPFTVIRSLVAVEAEVFFPSSTRFFPVPSPGGPPPVLRSAVCVFSLEPGF